MKRVLLVLLACVLAGCTNITSGLPDLGQVPAFTLTTQSGESFSSEELRGRVWVTDFFFTLCNGPCPRMSVQMRKLQDAVSDLDDVRLVSITIDPANDTPEALAAYARRYKANPERWWFLTGPADEIRKISYDAFHLSDVGGALEHSSRFALVDRKGRIRGYYETTDANALQQLVEDIKKVRKEIL